MWLTILASLLSYFLTYRATDGDKGKAAAAALVGGMGAAYAVTNTEWGSNAASSFNGALGISTDPLLTAKANDAVTVAQAGGAKTSVNTPPSGTTAWDVLKSWGASGTAMVAGTAATGVGLATGGISLTTILLIGGAFLLLKG